MYGIFKIFKIQKNNSYYFVYSYYFLKNLKSIELLNDYLLTCAAQRVTRKQKKMNNFIFAEKMYFCVFNVFISRFFELQIDG